MEIFKVNREKLCTFVIQSHRIAMDTDKTISYSIQVSHVMEVKEVKEVKWPLATEVKDDTCANV